MQHLGGLGKAAVVDHRLQGAPLIKGHAGRFHDECLKDDWINAQSLPKAASGVMRGDEKRAK
ncbi:hypothetical protein Pfra02_43050 [Pseudomonas fragi]|nr:hypothetical protein Pfra02_43050 [Pseudomonas fragi]